VGSNPTLVNILLFILGLSQSIKKCGKMSKEFVFANSGHGFWIWTFWCAKMAWRREGLGDAVLDGDDICFEEDDSVQ
jgi:hypothetical protein